MKPKLVVDNDNDVVVKTYYPRERKAPSFRQQIDRQWAARQAADAAERARLRESIEEANNAIRAANEALQAMGEKVPVIDIIRRVAVEHGFDERHILGQRRSREFVAARHEAICEAARLRPDLSLPQLGRAFHRDHTSILSCLRKHGIR